MTLHKPIIATPQTKEKITWPHLDSIMWQEVLQPDVSKKKEHTVHSEGEYEAHGVAEISTGLYRSWEKNALVNHLTRNWWWFQAKRNNGFQWFVEISFVEKDFPPWFPSQLSFFSTWISQMFHFLPASPTLRARCYFQYPYQMKVALIGWTSILANPNGVCSTLFRLYFFLAITICISCRCAYYMYVTLYVVCMYMFVCR